MPERSDERVGLGVVAEASLLDGGLEKRELVGPARIGRLRLDEGADRFIRDERIDLVGCALVSLRRDEHHVPFGAVEGLHAPDGPLAVAAELIGLKCGADLVLDEHAHFPTRGIFKRE